MEGHKGKHLILCRQCRALTRSDALVVTVIQDEDTHLTYDCLVLSSDLSGLDDRHYLVDLARAFPPESPSRVPHLEGNCYNIGQKVFVMRLHKSGQGGLKRIYQAATVIRAQLCNESRTGTGIATRRKSGVKAGSISQCHSEKSGCREVEEVTKTYDVVFQSDNLILSGVHHSAIKNGHQCIFWRLLRPEFVKHRGKSLIEKYLRAERRSVGAEAEEGMDSDVDVDADAVGGANFQGVVGLRNEMEYCAATCSSGVNLNPGYSSGVNLNPGYSSGVNLYPGYSSGVNLGTAYTSSYSSADHLFEYQSSSSSHQSLDLYSSYSQFSDTYAASASSPLDTHGGSSSRNLCAGCNPGTGGSVVDDYNGPDILDLNRDHNKNYYNFDNYAHYMKFGDREDTNGKKNVIYGDGVIATDRSSELNPGCSSSPLPVASTSIASKAPPLSADSLSAFSGKYVTIKKPSLPLHFIHSP